MLKNITNILMFHLRNNHDKRNKYNGYTLIEIIIVLAIIAILTSFAIPSYDFHRQRAKRIEAQAALLDMAVLMEQYYAKNHTYVGEDLNRMNQTPRGDYLLSVDTTTETTYVLKASLISENRNLTCGILTLSNTNQREPQECW